MRKGNFKLDDTIRAVALQELWLRANHGVFASIATQLSVTPEAVRRVYRGLSRSARVEGELRRRGAPVAEFQGGKARRARAA
jgi:hypothetical protein